MSSRPATTGSGPVPAASVNAVTKSGTNAFSGSVFDYDAATWFRLKLTGNELLGRAPRNYARHHYGGSLAVPIIRDPRFLLTLDRQVGNEPIRCSNGHRRGRRFARRASSPDRGWPFINLAKTTYGYDLGQESSAFQQTSTNAFFGRLDWQLTIGTL